MQPQISKEQPRNQRERPLQKSMFLPDQYSSLQPQINAPRNQPEFAAYNPMKRSSTAIIEGMPSSSVVGNNAAFQYNNYSFNGPNQNSSFLGQLGNIHHDSRSNSQQELMFHHHAQRNPNHLHLSATKIETEKNSNKGERSSSLEMQNGETGLDQKTMIEEIITQMKEKHLPQAINLAKKQLYEDIYNLRVELQSVQEEFKIFCKKQEAINNDNDNKFKNISISTINFSQNNIHNISSKSKKQTDFNDLQTQFFLLEAKITQIETKALENNSTIFADLNRINERLDSELKQKSWKVGPIRSSLNSIMLEYRQSFTMQSGKGQQEDNEVLLSSCNYFIDKQGYLLDKENRYLIDAKGHQIKLEEKHLKLLESHKILQKAV